LKGILISDEIDGVIRTIKGNQFINASLGSEFTRIRNLSNLETFNEEKEEKSIRMMLPFNYSSYNTLVKYKDISLIPFERNSLISSNEILETNEIKPNEIQLKEFLNKMKQNFNIPIERIDIMSCWFENRRNFTKMDQNGLVNGIVLSCSQLVYHPDFNLSETLPVLYGSQNFHHYLFTELKLKYNLDNETSRYLKRNYGDRSEDIVLIMLNENKKEKISIHFPFYEAELIYSIRNEFTLDCIDFMDYRTNMIKLNGHEAMECIDRIATIIGVRNFLFFQRIG
jgi:hypothetical protein